MKINYKIAILLLSLVVGAIKVYPQAIGQIKTGGSLMMGFPSEEYYKSGLGGSFEYKFFTGNNFAIGAQIDIVSFSLSNEYIYYESSERFMPVIFTIDSYFRNKGLKPFFGLGTGLYFDKYTIDVYESKDIYMGFAPHFGFLYEITNRFDLNITANYHIVFGNGEKFKYFTLGCGVLYNLSILTD